MNQPSLTPEGRAYALAHPESLVALVALAEESKSTDWPSSHVATAVKVCNEQGSKGSQ